MAHRVGEVELALGVVGVEVREAFPERVGVEGVDGGVHLAHGELLRRRVARLDDRAQPPGLVADDPAVGARLVRLEREDGRGGALGPVHVEEPAKLGRGEERRVAGQDEHVAGEALERRARRGGRVAGSARRLLDGERDSCGQRALELGPRPRRGDDDERLGPELQRCADRPVDEPAAEELVQVLRPARPHAGAEAGGHHDRCEGSLGHGRVMAGAGGFEPPITGPKPAALPTWLRPTARRV